METHPDFLPVHDPELRTVYDSMELAFFSEPFLDCDLDALPYHAQGDETWGNAQIRTVTGFDPTTRCHIEVRNFTYDAVTTVKDGEDTLAYEDILVITCEYESEDEFLIYLNLTAKALFSSETSDDGSHDLTTASDEEKPRLIELTKQLLGHVTDI